MTPVFNVWKCHCKITNFTASLFGSSLKIKYLDNTWSFILLKYSFAYHLHFIIFLTLHLKEQLSLAKCDSFADEESRNTGWELRLIKLDANFKHIEEDSDTNFSMHCLESICLPILDQT